MTAYILKERTERPARIARMKPLFSGIRGVTRLATKVFSLNILQLPFEKLRVLDIDLVTEDRLHIWTNVSFSRVEAFYGRFKKYPELSTLAIRSHADGLHHCDPDDEDSLAYLIENHLGCTKLTRFEFLLTKSRSAAASESEQETFNVQVENFDHVIPNLRGLTESLEELKIDFKRHDGRHLSYDPWRHLFKVEGVKTLTHFKQLKSIEVLQEVFCGYGYDPNTVTQTLDVSKVLPDTLERLTIIHPNEDTVEWLADLEYRKYLKSAFPNLSRITLLCRDWLELDWAHPIVRKR